MKTWADIVNEWRELTAEGMTNESKKFLDKVFTEVDNDEYKEALETQLTFLNYQGAQNKGLDYTQTYLREWLEQEFQHRQMKKAQQQENPSELEQRIKNSLYSLDSWAMGFLGYTYANLIFSSTMFITTLVNESIDALLEENDIEQYDEILKFKKAALTELVNKAYEPGQLEEKIRPIFEKFEAEGLVDTINAVDKEFNQPKLVTDYVNRKLAEVKNEHLGTDAVDFLMEKEIESFIQVHRNKTMKEKDGLIFTAQSFAKPVMNAAMKSSGLFFELTNDYIIGRQQSPQGDPHVRHRLSQQRMVRRA